MSQTTSPTLKGQCIAEFLGTALLIFFGVGCVAGMKAGRQQSSSSSTSLFHDSRSST